MSNQKTPKNSTSPCTAEPPLGKALFLLMRSIVFEAEPHPELDRLPLAQLRLLWTVRGFPNGTMKDCSERLMVSQSTVTQLADKLVKRGLIERHSDSQDRRVIRLRMSDYGIDLMEVVDAPRLKTIALVWERLSSTEQEQVLQAFQRVTTIAEQVRHEIERPMPPLPEKWREGEDVKEGEGSTPTSSVVDLMSRPIRGKATV